MSSIKKLKKSILFILIGLLPIIIAYSQSQDSIVYSSENNPNENGLNYSGYIIELEEAPLIIKALELQGTVNNNERLLAGFGLFEPVARIGFNLLSTTNDNIDKRLDEHRELLEKEKDNALSNIQNILGTSTNNPITGNAVSHPSNLNPMNQYKNAFNGFALNISSDEANQIKNIEGIKKIYPNMEVKASLMDSVPLINADDVWLLDEDGNNCSLSGKDCLTGKDVTIAIIDTGIDYTHPDLGNCELTENINDGSCEKVIGGYDFVNNDNNPIDDHGHGTHCAGIAAGNGVLKGVAPDAKLYSYKVLNSDGSGNANNIIASIERSVDPNQDYDYSDHLDVISLSLGGSGNPDDAMSQAIDNAVSAGVVAVIAAGNDGPFQNTIGSPGTARKAITVGATYKKDYSGQYWMDIDPRVDQITSFSSRGPVKWNNNTLVKPDIVAPGAIICSAQWLTAWDNKKCEGLLDDNEHVQISGTSMATPHIAGAIALIKQKNQDWTPDEIKMSLRNQGVDIDQDIFTQGYGRYNILTIMDFNGIPSIAKIDTNGMVDTTIDIIGTAKGREFSNYSLYYGIGISPTEWNIIGSGNLPIENNVLYSGFNSSLLREGTNFLKLVVWNTKGIASEDRSVLIIDNLKVKEPLVNDIYRLGETIEINGTIKGDFEYYNVTYGIGEKPNEWFDEGISLTNQGTTEIIDGIIATWDSSVVSNSNFYTFNITLYFEDGESYSEYINSIYFDTTLARGWPQKINYFFDPDHWDKSENTFFLLNSKNELISIYKNPSEKSNTRLYSINGAEETEMQIQNNILIKNTGSIKMASSLSGGAYYWAGYLEPVIDDVNKDNKKELFVYAGGDPTKIYGYKEDGSLLEGWPVEVQGVDLPGGNLGAPTIADVNKNGFKEIIVNGKTHLYIFRFDGLLLKKIRINLVSQPSTETVISDLDNDDNIEIIKKYEDFDDNPFIGQKVIVFDSNGDLLPGWPQITYDFRYDELHRMSCSALGFESTPAVGDLDNDGKKEIIVASIRNVFDDGFDPEDPWDKWHCEGRIYAFNIDGSNVEGFPLDIDGKIFASPAVADVNNDNFDEIIIGTINSKNENSGVYVIDRYGNILEGWPQLIGESIWASPGISDINNDGYLEILISALGFETSIFNYEGDVLEGWPQVTSWNNYRNLIVGDVDNDKIKDIIHPAGNGFYPSIENHGGIYAWNIEGQEIEGFPKVTESDAQAGISILDFDNDNKVELVASSDWDFDKSKEDFKHRGSIYVWNIESSYDESLNKEWPMYHHDPQHTGCYRCNELVEEQRPPSIINNTGNTIINGLLNLRIEKQDEQTNEWHTYENVIINHEVAVNPYDIFDFAELWNTQDVSVKEVGIYRVYGEVTQNGEILETASGPLYASYEFTVIKEDSPPIGDYT